MTTMMKVCIKRIDVSTSQTRKTIDIVAQERPLHVFLNRTHYSTIFCSPANLKELAVGHVLTEGIVKSVEEIQEIELSKEETVCRIRLAEDVDLAKRLKLSTHFSRVILSACGRPRPYTSPFRLRKIKSTVKVEAKTILKCVSRLNSLAETFRKTGGVHVAAIYKSNGTLVVLAEDVGRHNAVDKTIGAASMRKTKFDECFLALSGRMTGDVVFKAAQVGLPVIASLAAAIDSGIELAKEVDLTLVGFVRGKRMNVYSFPERIIS
jgi:FdhD protein